MKDVCIFLEKKILKLVGVLQNFALLPIHYTLIQTRILFEQAASLNHSLHFFQSTFRVSYK